MKRRTTLTDAGNTRNIWFSGLVLAIVALGGSEAFAVDPMGPPTARLKEGQVRAGIDYSYSRMDIDLTDGTWTDRLDGAFAGSGEAVSLTIKDFGVHKGYATVGYGLSDSWETFLRMGAANADFGDSIWDDGENFEGSIDFAVGGGIKATLYEEFYLSIGAVLQANWTKFDGTLEASHWAAPDPVEISLAEIQFALGATYLWNSRVSFYGGPFIHFLMGDFEDTATVLDEDTSGIRTTKYSWEINEGPLYGGYVGARIKIAEQFYFDIEFQHTQAAKALGGSLILRF
jgi:hypothetical protein